MKSFLSLIGLIFTALTVLAGFGIVVMWVYWWFLGMFTLGATWFSLPYWGTFLVIILVTMIVRPAFLLFAIVGFVGWTWTLNWHWYTGLLVYVPTVAVLVMSLISAAFLGIVAAILQLWANVADALRKPWK